MKRSTNSKWKAYIRPDGSFDFDALTAAQKEQYYAECETIKASGTRPLSAKDRKLLQKAAQLGRPRVGLGSQRAQITVEKGCSQRSTSLPTNTGLPVRASSRRR